MFLYFYGDKPQVSTNFKTKTVTRFFTGIILHFANSFSWRITTLILTVFLALTVFTSCGDCPEPHEEEVKSDFAKYRPSCKLISAIGTENSPPCFYWTVKYERLIGNLTSTKTEYWQYCCSDIFDNKQIIKVRKDSISNSEPIQQE